VFCPRLQESGPSQLRRVIWTAFHRRHVCPLQRLGHCELSHTPPIFPSCADHGLWIVRRSHPSQSKYLRRQRFCQEVWRLFTMLGCYLVHHIPCTHDRGNRRWNSRVSRNVQPAAGRLQTLYSNSLKHPIYCVSEAVHSMRLSLSRVGRVLNGLPFRGKGQGTRSRKLLDIRH
jgi:hypothetical protein